jgi:hypothetical protein
MMFRRVNILAAVASLSLLAACAPGQPMSQAGVSPGAGSGLPGAATPGKNCGGTGGVKVTPCPITLTRRTKPGFVVTVSGPGVVNSYLGGLNFCVHHQLCYIAEREGSSQTKWRITSGRYCGNADIKFSGVNAGNTEVGHAFLQVANRYCP